MVLLCRYFQCSVYYFPACLKAMAFLLGPLWGMGMGMRPRPLLRSCLWPPWGRLLPWPLFSLRPALLAWAGFLAAGRDRGLWARPPRLLWAPRLRLFLAAGRRPAPNLARPLLPASTAASYSAAGGAP